MKKILLIHTKISSLDNLSSIKKKILKKVYCKTPPLGPMWLQAYMKKQGYNVKLFDRFVEDDLKKLEKLINNFNPEIIGFSATSPGIKDAKETVQYLKKRHDFVSVIGGAHISSDPESFLNMDFDYGIIGEGEVAFKELMKFLNNKRKKGEVSNLIYEKDGKLIKNRAKRMNSLDHVAMPDYSDINLKKYSLSPASYKYKDNAVILISRGCPFQCTYCDRSVFGNKVTYRSLENVKKEINFLINKRGIKEIRFYDDTFTMNKDLVVDLSNYLKDKDVIWSCLTRVDQIDKEILTKMKEGGCYQVFLGLEAADDEVLKKYKKGITVEQSKKAIKLIKEVGLGVRASFIVGSPHETKETLQKTLDFTLENNIDFVNFSVFNMFPGSEIHEHFKGESELEGFEGYHTRSHTFTPEGMSEEEFDNYVSKMYKRFYLRPSYAWERIKGLETIDQISGYIYAFLYNLLF
ncbi:MAG: B12-binding domain-containing radical SAM protein [Patescibacteria group bacterium]